jgi:hypothetical protein
MRGKAQGATAAMLKFAELVASGMSQYEAYRVAYPGNKGNRDTIDKAAQRLAKHKKVAPVIVEVKARIEARMADAATYTREKALAELHSAFEMAGRLGKPNAMVQAAIGKSRVAGLLVDEPMQPITPLSSRTEDELRAKAFELGMRLGVEIGEKNGRVVATQPKAKREPVPATVVSTAIRLTP